MSLFTYPGSLCWKLKEVSSANNLNLTSVAENIIGTRRNNGPKQQPSGISTIIFACSQKTLIITVDWLLSF